jgi:hypothetical protein
VSYLDQPALRRLAGAPDTRPVPPQRTKVMVPFRNHTFALVTVVEWRPLGPGEWACLLRWGVRGQTLEGWYIHDGALMEPTDD